MKKIILAAALLAASTGFAAADTTDRCNPSQGNWQNAATTSCAISDAGGDKNAPVTHEHPVPSTPEA